MLAAVSMSTGLRTSMRNDPLDAAASNPRSRGGWPAAGRARHGSPPLPSDQSSHSTHRPHPTDRWVAQLCRTGDRVVEVAVEGSRLLPFLTRQRPDLHGLTVIGDVEPVAGGSSLLAIDEPNFAVTRREWDGGRPWPIAGPTDLIVDVGAAWAPTENRWRPSIGQAAEYLTPGGRLVVGMPAVADNLPELLRTAGLTLDVTHGVQLPPDAEVVDAALLVRYVPASAALFAAMRRDCPEEFVGSVVASVLPEAAQTVLRLCRKTW